MADYTTFVAAFPEFAGADEPFVTAKMGEATRELDVTLWGALFDDGVYKLTAQKLAKSPYGNSAKLSTTNGRTVYDEELDRLRRFIASGRGIT